MKLDYSNKEEFISYLTDNFILPLEVTGKVEASKNYTLNLTFLNLIDIKDFNIINSIYSTTYGDEIIAHLGKKVIDMKSDDSFVARIGGNEFVVWIEDVNENQISEGALVDIVKAITGCK